MPRRAWLKMSLLAAGLAAGSCDALWQNFSKQNLATCAAGEGAPSCGPDQVCDPLTQTCVNRTAPPPTLSLLEPAQAENKGGAAIRLSGTAFVSGARVRFGVVDAEVTQLSPTQLSVVMPPLPRTHGPLTVTVSNPDGQTASRADLFNVTQEITFAPARSFEFADSPVGLAVGDANEDCEEGARRAPGDIVGREVRSL